MSRLANALEGSSGKESWSGVPYVRIDGDTDSRDRQTACLQFKEDPTIRVALLSITAAGTVPSREQLGFQVDSGISIPMCHIEAIWEAELSQCKAETAKDVM